MYLRVFVIGATLVSGTTAITAQIADDRGFVVGSVAAPRGAKVSGTLVVDRGVDSATFIPITIVHGATPGPVLALIAGVHGSEYSPILALQQVLPRLDPREISGTVVLVHVANILAFLGRTIYTGPIDGYYAFHGTPELIARSREMAVAFGIDHVVLLPQTPKTPDEAIYTGATAVVLGKPSFDVECGGLGLVDPEAFGRIDRGVTSLLKHLRMLPGAPSPAEHTIFITSRSNVASEHDGIFYRQIKAGETVDAARRSAMSPISSARGSASFARRRPAWSSASSERRRSGKARPSP